VILIPNMITVAKVTPRVQRAPYRTRKLHLPALCHMTHEHFADVWALVQNDPAAAHALNLVPAPPGDVFHIMGARGDEVTRARLEAFVAMNRIALYDGALS